MEVVAVVAVPPLLVVVGLATCAAGRSRSVVDEVPAAVNEEACPPTSVGCVAPNHLDAVLVRDPLSRQY